MSTYWNSGWKNHGKMDYTLCDKQPVDSFELKNPGGIHFDKTCLICSVGPIWSW
jgi:hypothetical protein